MAERVTRGQGLLEGFLARRRARMVSRLLRDEAPVGALLDVGCGSHPFFLLQAPAAEPVGVDKLVPPEGRRIAGVRLLHHDVETDARLPFADDHFDAVTMLAVFEHIPRDPLIRLLADIRRVLRPEGTFVMTTPAGWTDPLLRAMARVGLVSSEEIDEHQDRYDHDLIRDYLTRAGFDPAEMRFGSFMLGANLWATTRA